MEFILQSFRPFSIDYCIVCPSIYDFRLPLWYIQTSTKFCSKPLSLAMYNMLLNLYHFLICRLQGPLWSWSYGSWIYSYLCNQCLLPLTLWVWIPLMRGVLDTTLCDKVCQWLAVSLWFSLGTLVSSTHKTHRRDIFEILLKVASNIIN